MERPRGASVGPPSSVRLLLLSLLFWSAALLGAYPFARFSGEAVNNHFDSFETTVQEIHDRAYAYFPYRRRRREAPEQRDGG